MECPDGVDIKQAIFAQRALRIVCVALDASYKQAVTAVPHQPISNTAVRAVFSYCMRNHMPLVRIARILDMDPKTIGNDCRAVERALTLSPTLEDTLDMLADLIEPLPGLVENGARFVECLIDALASGRRPKVVKSERSPSLDTARELLLARGRGDLVERIDYLASRAA